MKPTLILTLILLASQGQANPTLERPDFAMNILLLGDQMAGKSTLVQRYTQDFYAEPNLATLGIEYSMKTVQVHDYKIRLRFWDTAGFHRYRTITERYFAPADAILLVYDLHNPDLEDLMEWRLKIESLAKKDIPIILVGQKADLISDPEVIAQIRAFAEDWEVLYMEVSAKKNTNVRKLFTTLTKIAAANFELKTLEFEASKANWMNKF